MTAQDNHQLVAGAFDAWADGTGTVFDLLDDDVRWTVTGTCALAGTYTSKAQFLSEGLAPLAARLSQPIRPTVRSVVADGDWVVVLWDGRAVAVDDQPYDNTYSWHLRVEDGNVVEVVAFFDGQMLDSLFDRVPGPG
jgi:ketosteroid isomerase-like protein